MSPYANIKQLNEVVEKTALAIEEGKREIFDISEKAEADCRTVEAELVEIGAKARLVIKEVDELELKEKLSRVKLSNVSRNFNDFTEADIRKAYDAAKDLQVLLSLKRQEEKDLFKERTRLEMRLKDAREVLKKAESLTSKVTMAISLLRTGFTEQMEDLKQKQDMGLRIIEAQEAERKRVSRDIHDGPAQVMANVVLKAEYCERIIDEDIEGTKQELQGLKETVRESSGTSGRSSTTCCPCPWRTSGWFPPWRSWCGIMSRTPASGWSSERIWSPGGPHEAADRADAVPGGAGGPDQYPEARPGQAGAGAADPGPPRGRAAHR